MTSAPAAAAPAQSRDRAEAAWPLRLPRREWPCGAGATPAPPSQRGRTEPHHRGVKLAFPGVTGIHVVAEWQCGFVYPGPPLPPGRREGQAELRAMPGGGAVCGLPRRVTPAVRGEGRGRGPSCGLGWSFPSQAPSCPRAVCRSVSRKHVCSHTNPEKLGCTLARGLKTRSLGKVSARASQRPCRPPLSACVTGTPRCKGLGFGAAGTGPSTGVRDPFL